MTKAERGFFPVPFLRAVCRLHDFSCGRFRCALLSFLHHHFPRKKQLER